MLKYFILLIAILQFSLTSLAQNPADSAWQLAEVVIYDIPEHKFATGSKIISVDSAYLESQQSRSLSDLLLRKTSVYLKEYGPGMLSSIAFRGTSPSQTAVLWNGMNINSPTNGQSDFSLIPLFAVEDIAIQFGGSSALYGSDAIGGTIYLSSKPKWKNHLNLKLQQEVGSFGRNFSGLSTTAGFHKWAINSRVYYLQTDNNFEYINTTKKGKPREKNRNSAFEQKGLVQDIAYRISGRSSLSFKSWYQEADRQIQPQMGNMQANDRQEDKNLNLSLQYQNNGPMGFFDLQIGHLYNYLQFNSSEYRTWQNIGNLRYEKSLGQLVQLQAGYKTNFIHAAIEQYPEDAGNEVRNDFYASARIKPSDNFTTSINIRQAFVTGFSVPFTPSAGMEYTFLSSRSSQLTWLASAGRSYRVPTLNDRYWLHSGNPDLKPENSWNIDSGFKLNIQKVSRSFNLSTTVYSMWVDNWILWLPNRARGPNGNLLWAPVNIQEVHSKGLEIETSFNQNLSWGSIEIGGNIGFTSSLNKTAKNQYDRTVNKQLPFIPEITSNAFLSWRYKSWLASTNWTYVGSRFTTGEGVSEYSLPPFQFFDLALGKTVNFNSHAVSILFEVRNLLDEHYQNYENRAMPGRNYNLTAKYNFTQPN